MTRWSWTGMGVFLLGAVLIAGSAHAAKIAVVDTSKVVKEYQKTKDAQERLEKELDDKKNELQKMGEELEAEKADLERQKGIVSESKYKKLEEKFNKKQDTFRDKYKETQSVLMNKQRTLMEGIVNDVKDIVGQIAKRDKYELVLDRETVLYIDGQDITYKVLDELNAKK
ncbi:MAG: OmpH family outer membrane protein [candidate division FCPU426 bacterium]